MRFVVLSSLLGFCVAAAGLAFFGMGWVMAAAIWLLSGPAGAVLAIVVALTPPSKGHKAPVTVVVQEQAA